MSEVSTKNIDFVEYSNDAGVIYEVTCPKCNSKIRVANYAWWDTTCDCDIDWSLNITATGNKL